MSPLPLCLWCENRGAGESALCAGCAPLVHPCSTCTVWHNGATKCCADCLARRSAYYRRKKQACAEQKVCYDCGVASDVTRCPACRHRVYEASQTESFRERKRLHKELIVQAGRCTKCRTRAAHQGCKTCRVCLDAAHEYAQRAAPLRRERAAQARAEGRCGKCLKRDTIAGKALCAPCLAAQRARQEKKRSHVAT